MPPHPKPSKRAKKPSGLNRADAAAKATRKAAKPKKAMVVAQALPPEKVRKLAAKKLKPAQDGGTKTDLITAMLRRPGGATSRDMEQATGWAPHSVRGLLGTMRKRGIKVMSRKLPKEPTVYSIAADEVGDVV